MADQAELEIAIYDLLSAAEAHKGCSACAEAKGQGLVFCEPMRNATQALVDWRERRNLLSRAQYYRARWNLLEVA